MDENNNLIDPFKISYHGKHAEMHVLDAVQLGESISAAAKIYTSIAHLCITGDVPKGNYKKEFSCFVEAPQAGSVEAMLYIAPILVDGYMFAATHKDAISSLFWLVVECVKKLWTGTPRDEAVRDLSEAVSRLAASNAEAQIVLANGLVSANANLDSANERIAALHESLIRVLPEIADATRNHARQMVSPVGRSCTHMMQTSGGQVRSEITEAEADVIRSKDDLQVGDAEAMECLSIIELNLRTAHCELTVDRYEGVVIGKITDPQLEQPGNIYSRSLDRQTSFSIVAKPVMKDGNLHRLYISDAR